MVDNAVDDNAVVHGVQRVDAATIFSMFSDTPPAGHGVGDGLGDRPARVDQGAVHHPQPAVVQRNEVPAAMGLGDLHRVGVALLEHRTGGLGGGR